MSSICFRSYFVKRMFSGFKSPWTRPALLMCFTASRRSYIIDLALSSLKTWPFFLLFLIYVNSSPPSSSLVIIRYHLSCEKNSFSYKILAWRLKLSEPVSSISDSNLFIRVSSFSRYSFFTTLNAHNDFLTMCRQILTSPYLPCPIRLPI